MRILLVESSEHFPAPLFEDALRSVAEQDGHETRFFDESSIKSVLRGTRLHRVWYRLSGKRPTTFWALNRGLLDMARSFKPELMLITKGAFVSRNTLETIKRNHGTFIVNYLTDDPLNPAAGTPVLRKALSAYDLVASTKTAIVDDLLRLGCPRVEFVPFGYKPSVHFPQDPVPSERERFSSDVAFVGGGDRDRFPYFEALLRTHPEIRLNLYGGGWAEHPLLRRYARGFATGEDFRKVVGAAAVCVNLVRRANRDGHVMRTFELPACGATVLAERTNEHLRLFQEDREAVFFTDAEEMSIKIGDLLRDPTRRSRIANEGHRAVVTGGHTYNDRLGAILSFVAEGR